MFSKPFDQLKPSHQTLLIALAGAVALLPYRLQLHAGINDEGIVIQAARRILSGQMPYRDFDLFYPPGSMAITALWLGGTGYGIASARWLMVLCGAATIAVIFAISRRLLSGRMQLLPAALFAVSGFSEWPVLSYHWFAILGLLTCLWQLLEWRTDSSRKSLLLSGAACGFAGACLQSEGVASFLGAMIVLGMERETWRERLRAMATFVAGVALIWLPLALILGLSGALPAFVDNAILRVLSGLYHSHAAPYSLDKYLWSGWASLASQWPSVWTVPRCVWALESVASQLTFTLKYGLIFPVTLAICALALRHRRDARALAVFLVLLTFVKRERLDLLYSNYLMPLWYVALALLLAALCSRYGKIGRAALIALVSLYVVNLGFAIRYTSSFVYPVDLLAGTLYSRQAEEAEAFRELYGAAARLSPPGSQAFVWPYAASFYAFAETENPTRVDFLVPGWQEPAQAEQVSRDLAGVSYLYFFPLDPGVLADYPNIDPKAFARGLEAQRALVCREFEPFGQAGPAIIYRRRGTAPPGKR